MITDPARKRRTDPATRTSARSSTCTAPSRRPDAGVGRRGCRSAGIGCLDCKAKLAEHVLEAPGGRPRPAPGAREAPRHRVGDPARGSKKAREVAEPPWRTSAGAMKIRYPRP